MEFRRVLFRSSDFIYLSGLRYVPLPHSRSNNGSLRPLRSGRGVSQRPIKRRQFLLPKSHFGGLARSRGRCVPGLVTLQNAPAGLAGLFCRCSRVNLELAPAVQPRSFGLDPPPLRQEQAAELAEGVVVQWPVPSLAWVETGKPARGVVRQRYQARRGLAIQSFGFGQFV